MHISLSESQSRAIIEDLDSRPQPSAHTQVWSRRSYAPMHIHTKAFADVKAALEESLHDYVVAFDVVFESKGGEVTYHCDYESLGPFIVQNRWRAVRDSHFLSVHFNLTNNGGCLVTHSSIVWAYLFYLAISINGIFGWAHRLLLKVAPLASNQKVHQNAPRIGNVFDNTRLHMITSGSPRTSYVVRLVKKGGCVLVSKESFALGSQRSAACGVFQSIGNSLTSAWQEDAAEVDWGRYGYDDAGAD